MNLPRFSLTRRTLVMFFVAALVALGVDGFRNMSRREDPEILIRFCTVITQWPGATVENVEDLVTDPLEESIGQLAEVKRITSQSRVGQSIISVEYEDWVKDTAATGQLVRNKVLEVQGKLPQGCGRPAVNDTMGDVSAIVLSLHQIPPPGGDSIERPYTPRELELLADTVRDELKTIPSVAQVTKMGVEREVIYLEVDGADWSQVQVTAQDLSSLLDARNIVAPGGTIHTSEGLFTVNPTGQFQDVSELGDVLVSVTESGAPVRLSDLDTVTVRRTYADPPMMLTRFTTPEYAGAPAIVLGVEMKEGQNIVVMGEEVDRTVRRLYETVLPPDVELVRTNDLPRQVDVAVKDFSVSLLQGIAIVLLVAWLVMGLRPALIMAAALPISMIGAIALMPLFGVELERFSIASLIIALGMVVDNAIVVSDNSVRLLGDGKDRLSAMMRGAQGLAGPILASTLTTVLVFLPMAFMPGSSGEYVRSLPIVVGLTLLLSYVVGMCVTPILCYWLLRPAKEGARTPGGWLMHILSRPFGFLRRKREEGDERPGAYERVAAFCLARKAVPLLVSVAALIGAFSLPVGSEFYPPGFRDQFFIKVWLPEGATIRETEEVCAIVEERIRETRVDEETGENRLVNAQTYVGFGGPRLSLTISPEERYPNFAYVVVNTTRPEVSEGWVEDLQPHLDAIPGTRVQAMAAPLGPPLDYPVQFRLSGADAEVLREAAERMIAIYRSAPGAREPFSDWENDSYQIEVEIDEDAANLAGVTNRDVADSLQTLLSGRRLTQYREGDHVVDVILRTKPEDRIDLETIDRIFVNGRAGKVPLGSVAEPVATWAPAVIRRRDQVRTVTVSAMVREGYLANEISDAVEPEMIAMLDDLPAGYRMEVGGSKEMTIEGQEDQGTAMMYGLLLVVLVLVSQYNSLLKPVVILATLPLALIGSMVGLFVTGWALGFMATLGIISLFGVVINNAIVLIDFIQENLAEGMELRDATIQAGKTRMRPILLTTATTIGGLLPLGFFGGPLFAPMAWAMIFGLAFSTGLTLLVIPTVYVLFVERFGMKTS